MTLTRWGRKEIADVSLADAYQPESEKRSVGMQRVIVKVGKYAGRFGHVVSTTPQDRAIPLLPGDDPQIIYYEPFKAIICLTCGTVLCVTSDHIVLPDRTRDSRGRNVVYKPMQWLVDRYCTNAGTRLD